MVDSRLNCHFSKKLFKLGFWKEWWWRHLWIKKGNSPFAQKVRSEKQRSKTSSRNYQELKRYTLIKLILFKNVEGTCGHVKLHYKVVMVNCILICLVFVFIRFASCPRHCGYIKKSSGDPPNSNGTKHCKHNSRWIIVHKVIGFNSVRVITIICISTRIWLCQ